MTVLDLFRLDGQVAVVTGVGRGLGQAAAIALAEAGADIVGVYHTRFEDTQAAVLAAGRRFMPFELNLLNAQPADFAHLVDRVLEKYGHLDILVNNAGIIRRAPALEYTEEDWDAVLQVNLKAAFFLSQAAARPMVQQKRGKIIQIASLLSFQGGILVPSYASAKSGLAGLTQALSNEWAALGINVNAIAPGYMETDNTAALRADPVRYPAILNRIPAGRWGVPEDVKGITVFLASPASDYLHGAIIPVDGGWLGR
jgi:2-deoxy-D-gluconate 3-dehydrogenase